VVTEAGSYLRPIDSCITQLKAQGPSRTCNESKEEVFALSGSGIKKRKVHTLRIGVGVGVLDSWGFRAPPWFLGFRVDGSGSRVSGLGITV